MAVSDHHPAREHACLQPCFALWSALHRTAPVDAEFALEFDDLRLECAALVIRKVVRTKDRTKLVVARDEVHELRHNLTQLVLKLAHARYVFPVEGQMTVETEAELPRCRRAGFGGRARRRRRDRRGGGVRTRRSSA